MTLRESLKRHISENKKADPKKKIQKDKKGVSKPKNILKDKKAMSVAPMTVARRS